MGTEESMVLGWWVRLWVLEGREDVKGRGLGGSEGKSVSGRERRQCMLEGVYVWGRDV